MLFIPKVPFVFLILDTQKPFKPVNQNLSTVELKLLK